MTPMTANNPKQPSQTQSLEAELLNLLGDVFDEARMAHVSLAVKYLLQMFERERIAAERATRERVLEEAARKAEHSCYDYANTIEPSINDDGSKAFGFGFDYACEVIAAAIRALQEPKV